MSKREPKVPPAEETPPSTAPTVKLDELPPPSNLHDLGAPITEDFREELTLGDLMGNGGGRSTTAADEKSRAASSSAATPPSPTRPKVELPPGMLRKMVEQIDGIVSSLTQGMTGVEVDHAPKEATDMLGDTVTPLMEYYANGPMGPGALWLLAGYGLTMYTATKIMQYQLAKAKQLRPDGTPTLTVDRGAASGQ